MKFRPLYIVIGALVLLGFWMWGSYNAFVSGNESVNALWAQVETQYQRRFDLVPNLVETVKGAARFEQETFREVTEARSRWSSAKDIGGKIEAAQGLDTALGRLLVTFENYPQLQATQAYRDLMAQLEGTENRISVARRDYNESVRGFNVLVKRFPGNILAGLFGFGPKPFFEAAEGAGEAPDVTFE